MALTGPGELLKAMTKTVIETALDEEIAEHLGYDRHAVEGRGSGNSRNGTRVMTVLTDACGAIEIEVPRDRAGTFEPQIVKKRQRRLGDVDEVVLSLDARGLTTGEISAHFADIYGAAVSKDTISRITDKVIEEMAVAQRMRSTPRWTASTDSAPPAKSPRSSSSPASSRPGRPRSHRRCYARQGIGCRTRGRGVAAGFRCLGSERPDSAQFSGSPFQRKLLTYLPMSWAICRLAPEGGPGPESGVNSR